MKMIKHYDSVRSDCNKRIVYLFAEPTRNRIDVGVQKYLLRIIGENIPLFMERVLERKIKE